LAGLAKTGSDGQNLLVLGGAGFVGNEVCKRAVRKGYQVTSLSRRGQNPDPSDETLRQVEWIAGDATDLPTVQSLVAKSDCAVPSLAQKAHTTTLPVAPCSTSCRL